MTRARRITRAPSILWTLIALNPVGTFRNSITRETSCVYNYYSGRTSILCEIDANVGYLASTWDARGKLGLYENTYGDDSQVTCYSAAAEYRGQSTAIKRALINYGTVDIVDRNKRRRNGRQFRTPIVRP